MNKDFNYEVIVMIHNLKVEGFSKMLDIFSVFNALYNLHCFELVFSAYSNSRRGLNSTEFYEIFSQH
jgi:hypothetical protein